MAAGSWGCPHEIDTVCSKINGRPCDPGMKGCELYGRYTFFAAAKNTRREQKKAHAANTAQPQAAGNEKEESSH